jgi:hypothetical protein
VALSLFCSATLSIPRASSSISVRVMPTYWRSIGACYVRSSRRGMVTRSTPRAMASSWPSNAPRTMAAHAWPEGASVRVRMGLHTGEPTLTTSGYVGLDVHRAARLCAVGHGGQTLLSQTTRALVEYDLPAPVSLRDLGEHRLKDLQRPERIYQLVIPDLPADFPPLTTLDRRSPHNLPVQPTSWRRASRRCFGAWQCMPGAARWKRRRQYARR